jgi:hypothetical protein
LFWDLSSGTWSVTAAPLPADAQASSDPAFSPFTCPATGVCLSVGTYLGSSGRESLVESDPSLPATTTAVSVKAVSASTLSYSATVTGSTSAPTGTVVFSAGLDYLCSARVVGTTATCTGAALPTPQIVGSYSGDSANAPSWGTAASPPIPNAVAVVSATTESTKTQTFFAGPLSVEVTATNGAGVAGMPVTFVFPTTGATAIVWGPTTVVTNAAGVATSPWLMANDVVGSYVVWAVPAGLHSVAAFILTNKRK